MKSKQDAAQIYVSRFWVIMCLSLRLFPPRVKYRKINFKFTSFWIRRGFVDSYKTRNIVIVVVAVVDAVAVAVFIVTAVVLYLFRHLRTEERTLRQKVRRLLAQRGPVSELASVNKIP